jgi:hypothetical protein
VELESLELELELRVVLEPPHRTCKHATEEQHKRDACE